MWGKRTGRKSKMENMRRWGKRSGSKVLRGMWGKRSGDQEAMSYIICATQPAVHMFFCKKYPTDDDGTVDEFLPEKNNYELKGLWG